MTLQIKGFFKKLVHYSLKDKVFDMAAQLSYFLLLAIFPFLILIFTLLRFLPISTGSVLDFISPYAPEGAMQLIEDNLYQVLEVTRGDLLSISMVATIWLSAMGASALIRTLNSAHQVEESRPFLRALGVAVLLTIGMILGVIISLILMVFGREIGLSITSLLGVDPSFLQEWNTFRWTFSFIILVALVAGLYYFVPNKKLRFLHILPGTLFAVAGWQLASLGFSYYVSIADYSLIYGNLGTIVILLIWLYLSSLIVLIGGEINAIISDNKSER